MVEVLGLARLRWARKQEAERVFEEAHDEGNAIMDAPLEVFVSIAVFHVAELVVSGRKAMLRIEQESFAMSIRRYRA